MGASSNRYSALGGLLGIWLVLPSALIACGGSAPAASSPATTAHAKAAPGPSDDSAEDESPAEEESAPPRSACDDGSCSPCGTGMCPTGWYCDESASGGPACSWLPKCAQKSSCGCVSSALGSACKCVEQGGGLHVTCK